MHGAWQTPHGARPNREGMEDGASRFPCVSARRAKLPGRSLESFSNDRPRGMTVTAAMPYRIRLIGSTSLVAPTIGNDCGGFQFYGLRPCPLLYPSQIGVEFRSPTSIGAGFSVFQFWQLPDFGNFSCHPPPCPPMFTHFHPRSPKAPKNQQRVVGTAVLWLRANG
jgi:hypothetical protein